MAVPPGMTRAPSAGTVGLHWQALSPLVRTCRVPLQYLTNTVHWRELILAVGPGVLIPRPETELLIDFAQQVCFRPGLGSAGCCCSVREGAF